MPKMRKKKTGLFRAYGEHWSRHEDNIEKSPGRNSPYRYGVYVLYDGLFPVYIGKADEGSIGGRIKRHHKSRKMKNYWDRFSWYSIKDRKSIHEIEALLLRILPYFSRILTGMRGNINADKQRSVTDRVIGRKIPKTPPKKVIYKW